MGSDRDTLGTLGAKPGEHNQPAPTDREILARQAAYLATQCNMKKNQGLRVGYLWDSLSPNTGDQAIGQTFLRLADKAGVTTISPVDIGEPIGRAYDLLVIGGGEVLQPSGRPFYDVFRVPGPHILNTVGTSGTVDVGYLNDYRYVSVRSQQDMRNLTNFDGEAVVAPCLTVLFDELAISDETPAIPVDTVGLHAHPTSLGGGDIGAGVTALQKHFPERVALFPFTFYNRDQLIEEALAELFELPAPLPIRNPDSAFEIIRRFRGVVTSSLHATIMAYISGVPFLVFAYADKVGVFLKERGLTSRLLSRPEDIAERIDLLDPTSVDWDESLRRDRTLARQAFESILAEIDDARTNGQPKTVAQFDLWREPTHPKAANKQLLAVYSMYGERLAEKLRSQTQLSRLESWIASLQELSTQVQSELEKTSRYCGALESSLTDHKSELEEATRYTSLLESSLTDHKSEIESAQLSQRRQEEEIQKHREAQLGLGEFAGSLQGEVETAAKYAHQLEHEVAGRGNELQRVQAYVSALEMEIAAQKGAQSELTSYVEKLLAELEKHRELQKEVARYVSTLEEQIAIARRSSDSSSSQSDSSPQESDSEPVEKATTSTLEES